MTTATKNPKIQPPHKTPSERKKISPLFQVLMIAINLIITSFMLTYRLTYFRTQDIQPKFQTITPKKLKEFGGFPGIIKVGLYIDQFQDFSMVKNKFSFNGVVWFEMNTGLVSIDTLEQFNFEQAKILYRSPPDTKIIKDKLLVLYNVRIEFSSRLNFADFPFDDHRIHLILTHPFISPEEVLFSSSQREFVLKAETMSYGWKVVNHLVKTGYIKSQLDKYDKRKTLYNPTAVFFIDFERYGFRYIISIILPLFLILYLVFFSLSLNTNPSVSLSTGGITAILAYRFVIENLSPVSGDFMLSDKIFFLVLAASCLIFFFNTFDLFAIQLRSWQKKMVITAIHGAIILCTSYLLLT